MEVRKIKLGLAGKQFRAKVLKEYDIIQTHDLKRLDMAAQILDRLELCDADIRANGAFFSTKTGQKRENPALKSEREMKIAFCRIIRELCLEEPEPENQRPPRRK